MKTDQLGPLERDVHDVAKALTTLGYKVSAEKIHSYYIGAQGDYWPQTGWAIRVFPHMDKE